MNKYNKYLLVESPVAASGFLSVVLRFLFSLTWHSGEKGRTRKGNREKKGARRKRGEIGGLVKEMRSLPEEREGENDVRRGI